MTIYDVQNKLHLDELLTNETTCYMHLYISTIRIHCVFLVLLDNFCWIFLKILNLDRNINNSNKINWKVLIHTDQNIWMNIEQNIQLSFWVFVHRFQNKSVRIKKIPNKLRFLFKIWVEEICLCTEYFNLIVVFFHRKLRS